MIERGVPPRGLQTGSRRIGAGRAVLGLAVVAWAVAALVAAPISAASTAARSSSDAAAPISAASPSRWTGGVNLYRAGSFTTQASILYCTAADIQIIRNMVRGTNDHSASAQKTYFDWMRTQNRYDLPLSAGVDAAGWTAGMKRYVDARYALVSSPSFSGTLKQAVTSIRETNLPVALAVAHGDHAWILNGFTATADPAVTSSFTITSVYVTGPLWGRQSVNGYDMPPNTKLTVAQLATFFTRWHYDPVPMVWDGSFVSIQPNPAAAAAPSTTATPGPVPSVTASPTTPAPTPAPTATPAVPSPTPTAVPMVADAATAPASTGSAAEAGSIGSGPAAATGSSAPATGLALAAFLAVGVMLGVLIVRRNRRSRG